MQSRTSFFDSRIYRNVLSRFWLLGLGCALLWVFTIFSGMDVNNIYYNETAGVQLLRSGVRGGAMLCMFTGAAVAVARRGGCSATFDELNKYFTISGMPVASSTYWNSVHGAAPGEAARDA